MDVKTDVSPLCLHREPLRKLFTPLAVRKDKQLRVRNEVTGAILEGMIILLVSLVLPLLSPTYKRRVLRQLLFAQLRRSQGA
jgi:hypothetical protein